MEISEQAEKDLAERAPEVAEAGRGHGESFKAFDEQARVQQQQLESARVERERLMNELPKTNECDVQTHRRPHPRRRRQWPKRRTRRVHRRATWLCRAASNGRRAARRPKSLPAITAIGILYYAPDKAAQPVGV